MIFKNAGNTTFVVAQSLRQTRHRLKSIVIESLRPRCCQCHRCLSAFWDHSSDVARDEELPQGCSGTPYFPHTGYLALSWGIRETAASIRFSSTVSSRTQHACIYSSSCDGSTCSNAFSLRPCFSGASPHLFSSLTYQPNTYRL